MQVETHNLGGDFLFFPRPGVRVTGQAGGCLRLEVPEGAGLSIFIIPVDPAHIYVVLGLAAEEHVLIAQYPYPVVGAAAFVISHTLKVREQKDVVTVLAPTAGTLCLLGIRAADTNANLLLMQDRAIPSDLDKYFENHTAFKTPEPEDMAGLKLVWSAVEAAIMQAPDLSLPNLASVFIAGISFGQVFPNITKWGVQASRVIHPLWEPNTPDGFLYQELSDLEAVLSEREWTGGAIDSGSDENIELSPELKALLEKVRDRQEKQEGQDEVL